MPKATKEETSKKTAPAKGKVTKSKKEKDPNAPKRPQTAYFLWLNDNRAAIKKENPDASITEIAKIGGEKWKNLTAAEKSKYEALNAKDKERYEKEKAAYEKKQ